MPLPKINTPTYELVLPSNNKKVKYRPFLVREEKILVMALESEDMSQITNSIIQILTDCILTKGIDVASLATFDIEYLFLNIRAKSVGESVEVNVTCPDDNRTTVEIDVNIDSIKVKKNRKHKDTVKLDDTLSLKLKYPSVAQFIDNNFEVSDDTGDSVAKSLSMITSCMDMIYNDEESWDASESTTKELTEFIEQLNTKQFKEIEKFFETMPKLSHKLKVTNPKTGVESEVLLEGLASFFS
tara:strand:- start:6025 stop:6750 length:726 start_codon:yes stop_codon:yes gene_type:complete